MRLSKVLGILLLAAPLSLHARTRIVTGAQPGPAVAAGGGDPVATDTFNRADAATITSSGEGGHTWSSGDSFSITGNKVDPETSADYSAVYSYTPTDADYCESLDIEANASGRSTIGPSVRNSGGNKYRARFSNGNIEIYKNGTSLGTPVAVATPTTAKTLKLCASGSATTTLDVYYDGAGSPTMTYADSSSPLTTAGNPGISCFFCDANSDVLGDNAKTYETVGP
jgi:hypothetical protein